MSDYFILICESCGYGDSGDPNEQIPSNPPAEGWGHWAADHTQATGHKRWIMLDPNERLARGFR